MKIFAYDLFLNKAADLMIDLIPMGLECVDCPSRDELVSAMKKDITIPILLTGTQDIDQLKQIKEINPSINIFLIVKNDMKPELIKSLLPVGVNAIINFSQNTAHIAEEVIRFIIVNNIHKKDQRIHVRVRPKETEVIKSALCIKEINRYVKGKVIDISAGGCAVKFDNASEMSLLAPKTIYDPLLIMIEGIGIKTLATLINLRNDSAGFHFDNVEQAGMRKIAKYIYRRMIENPN